MLQNGVQNSYCASPWQLHHGIASGKWKMGTVSVSICFSTSSLTLSGRRQQPSSPLHGTGVGSRMEALKMLQKGPPACGPRMISFWFQNIESNLTKLVLCLLWPKRCKSSFTSKSLNVHFGTWRRSPGVGPSRQTTGTTARQKGTTRQQGPSLWPLHSWHGIGRAHVNKRQQYICFRVCSILYVSIYFDVFVFKHYKGHVGSFCSC